MTKSDKIKQLKSSLKNTKAQLKRREAKIARLEARNSQLEAEAKKKRERQTYGAKSEEYYKTIPGHQFSEFVVQIAIAIRCATNASPRDIAKILEILANFTFGLVDKLPSYNTIDNWVRKCGLDEINQTPKALNDNNYAMIIDECMMIGSQKLLTMISVPAEHQGRPLQLDDARVVGFEVQTTWNAKKVKKVLEKSEGIIGKAAKYVISDNDAKMRKAIKSSDFKWHRDVSHTLALFMERVYKHDAEFAEFFNKIAVCKKQCCMKDVAYLQSPSQRCKAKFMNLEESVNWAYKMLQLYHKLTTLEKEVFSFLPAYASFIDEMQDIVSCVHFIEKEMKYNGLSKNTIAKCRMHINATIMCGNERMRRVGTCFLSYLSEEDGLLKDADIVNNSSDLIETTFGIFKYIQSPNKLNGVTTLVLHLPVILSFAGISNSKIYNVKEHLCRTRIKDITLWREKYLMENLVTKRIKTLKAA